MLRWFSNLLKAIVAADCHLQMFHAGQKSDINTDSLGDEGMKEYPMLCLVGFHNSTESIKDGSEVYDITLEFLALQGYKNDNSKDVDHNQVDYFDEVMMIGRSFMKSLDKTLHRVTIEQTIPIQLNIEKGTDLNWRRSLFAHNDRCISIQVDFKIQVRGATLCKESCDCNRVCIPVFEQVDPNKLLTPQQVKC